MLNVSQSNQLFPFHGIDSVELLGNRIYTDCQEHGSTGGWKVSCFFTDEGEFLGAQSQKFFSVNANDRSAGIGRNYGKFSVMYNCDPTTQNVLGIAVTWIGDSIFRFTDQAWASIEETRKSPYKDVLCDQCVLTNQLIFKTTESKEPSKPLTALTAVATKLNRLFIEKVNTAEGNINLQEMKIKLAKMAKGL